MRDPHFETRDSSILQRDWESAQAREIIAFAIGRFGAGAIVLANSFQIEDQAVLHMAMEQNSRIRVITIDTGLLHPETHAVIEETEKKYGVRIERILPDKSAVDKMVGERGPEMFYESIENRKLCCRTRKVEPLKRELAGKGAWFTGLRRDQAVTRQKIGKLEWDGQFGLFKINPIADWTTGRLWDYIKGNNIPYNKLYDRGFTSIGCFPCTRPATDLRDIRSGRWWWEDPGKKECGLHWKPAKERIL